MTEDLPNKNESIFTEAARVKLLAKYFKSASGLATAITATFPLSGLIVSELVPVWSAAPYLAVLSSFLGIVVVFFSSSDTDELEILKKGLLHLRVGTAFIAFYFVLSWFSVFNHDGARVVTGFVLSADAKLRIDDGTAASSTRRDLLALFGYEHSELIWSDTRIVDVMLNATFVVGAIMLSTGVFSFVLRNIAVDLPKRAEVSG